MKNQAQRHCLFFLCLLFVITVSAQNEKFQYGKVEKEELKSTFSPIDKNAEAEVLFEYNDVSLSLFNGRLEINIKAHTRIKIYNERGLDEANIKIPYISRNASEGIFKLEGQTYNLGADGNINISKLDKKSIYNKRIDNRTSNQIFTFPEVKTESIIEYTYTMKRVLLYLGDWSFQRNIPVRYSNVTIEYPSEFSFSHIARTTLPIDIKQHQNSYNVVKSFTMQNVPALKDEPYISCDDDYLQQVQFHLSGYYSPTLTLNLTKTWPSIMKDLMDDEDFGQQLKKNIQKTADLDEKLKPLNSATSKMAAIHNYVRNNMVWDESYSIWALDGVKKAWADKKGNSGEINLILVNLLKDAGLKAYPLLVSTRKHGKVNPLYPDLDQFNTVMALVMVDSSFYVMDATDKETPSHIIPQRVMYTEGLLINKVDMAKSFSEQDFGWVSIWNEKQKFNRMINISADMNADGKIRGQAFILNSDYARLASIESWKQGNEKNQEQYSNSHAGIKLSEFSQKNEEKDSLPIEQQFKFEVPADESGDYRYFSISMFSGLENNPFIADERSSDIFFGVNQKFSLRGIFNIPEGYSFEELPKDLRMVMPDKSITMTRYIQATGSKINYSVVIEFNQPFYAVSEYPDFKQFYKQMLEILNEQIVIKKAKP